MTPTGGVDEFIQQPTPVGTPASVLAPGGGTVGGVLSHASSGTEAAVQVHTTAQSAGGPPVAQSVQVTSSKLLRSLMKFLVSILLL